MMLHYYLSILPLCAKPSHTIILELLDLFDLAWENRNTPWKKYYSIPTFMRKISGKSWIFILGLIHKWPWGRGRWFSNCNFYGISGGDVWREEGWVRKFGRHHSWMTWWVFHKTPKIKVKNYVGDNNNKTCW